MFTIWVRPPRLRGRLRSQGLGSRFRICTSEMAVVEKDRG